MGNMRLPNQQVSGPSGLAKAILGSVLDISVPAPLGVQITHTIDLSIEWREQMASVDQHEITY